VAVQLSISSLLSSPALLKRKFSSICIVGQIHSTYIEDHHKIAITDGLTSGAVNVITMWAMLQIVPEYADCQAHATPFGSRFNQTVVAVRWGYK